MENKSIDFKVNPKLSLITNDSMSICYVLSSTPQEQTTLLTSDGMTFRCKSNEIEGKEINKK